jgi:hypothetical protein
MNNIIQVQYEKYIEAINKNLSLNEDQWYFKQDPHYRGVLEHVSYEIGIMYLNEKKTRYNNIFYENKNLLINLCKENDTYGKPVQSYFDNFTTCSPNKYKIYFT